MHYTDRRNKLLPTTNNDRRTSSLHFFGPHCSRWWCGRSCKILDSAAVVERNESYLFFLAFSAFSLSTFTSACYTTRHTAREREWNSISTQIHTQHNNVHSSSDSVFWWRLFRLSGEHFATDFRFHPFNIDSQRAEGGRATVTSVLIQPTISEIRVRVWSRACDMKKSMWENVDINFYFSDRISLTFRNDNDCSHTLGRIPRITEISHTLPIFTPIFFSFIFIFTVRAERATTNPFQI